MAEDDLAPGGAHYKSLVRAVATLERPRLAARLADYAGEPVNRVLRLMPRAANARLNAMAKKSILGCLDWAIDSLEEKPAPPMPWFSSAVAGFTGGVSGAFGWAALPFELPLTTTLMLRSIADIARHHGEDLKDLESRLACVEVLALGGERRGSAVNVGYWAARATLARLAGDAMTHLVRRGATDLSGPAAASFVAEVATRYGLVVSEKVAAGAAPIIGAIGGATLNVIFMDHFQRVADGHFTVRKLERRYGASRVQSRYLEVARRPTGRRV